MTISGGTRHGVIGCDVTETGLGGILLNGGDRRTLTPGGHYAENNVFVDCQPALHIDARGLGTYNYGARRTSRSWA